MYQLLARYYDLIHQQLVEDIPFILQLAQMFGDPILEAGCGTGRVLIPLVKAGYEVIGVDNERAMLEKAQSRLESQTEKVRRRGHLILQDVGELVLPGEARKAALVLFSYNTALHFRARELKAVLRRINPHMKERGQLFLDYASPFAIENAIFEGDAQIENRFVDPLTGEIITQKSVSVVDYVQQCLHTKWIFASSSGSDEADEILSVDIDYWYQFPHQLHLILQQTGFRIEHMWGDYEGSAFGEESERLLILAQRDD